MSRFGRLFGKKDHLVPFDLSKLGCDIHSHLIPGIDDGSPSFKDSLELARGLVDLGYLKAITTPHVMSDFYRNSPETIQNGLIQLKQKIQQAEIPLNIEAAAEYYIDFEFMEKVESNSLLTFGNNYLLVEFSFIEPPVNMNEVFFKLQTNGYRPVLAHPERYLYWHNNPKPLFELKDRDVLFQINLLSLMGNYGPQVAKAGELLIENKMVEWLGTDMHHANHLELLKNYQLKQSLVSKIEDLLLLNRTLL
ncbi:MAG: capsular biosynthesis protein [Bacteroidetes bacterium HGW-Bacteroidetes-4]|jgi:tyrosine-protein phosphatase YwqE|nr:MAG: capsular biosynthesis protein [Bacteroidetes bacterium HGW-Bacteroidetes-4]